MPALIQLSVWPVGLMRLLLTMRESAREACLCTSFEPWEPHGSLVSLILLEGEGGRQKTTIWKKQKQVTDAEDKRCDQKRRATVCKLDCTAGAYQDKKGKAARSPPRVQENDRPSWVQGLDFVSGEALQASPSTAAVEY
ncbi:hypothetical protein AK812_SmicGene9722 [Symbiodinium microadriaticum]|uniref:Uncharacterized protein n=1 Tax=Symbiodinium microadriaticum TaxID=2951 RepID=A0A1Q9EHN0_SYMMI|nr:hypothetical protein AK812_SmicGene9722 [Symbiodinium microadriaticum]